MATKAPTRNLRAMRYDHFHHEFFFTINSICNHGQTILVMAKPTVRMIFVTTCHHHSNEVAVYIVFLVIRNQKNHWQVQIPIFPWLSYGFLLFPMVFLWFSPFSYGFPMVFLWFSTFSYGFPMVVLWFSPFSYGVAMIFSIFLWFSYGVPMVFHIFLWFSHGFPMVFHWPCRPALQISTMFWLGEKLLAPRAGRRKSRQPGLKNSDFHGKILINGEPRCSIYGIFTSKTGSFLG